MTAEFLDITLRLFRATGDAIRGVDLQIVVDLSRREREKTFLSCARNHYCPTLHILSFEFTIGRGFEMFASSVREKPLIVVLLERRA